MKKIIFVLATFLWILPPIQAQRSVINMQTDKELLAQWQGLKYGMFIHYMVCHSPETGDSWSIGNPTPKSVADSISLQWNPVKFDPRAMVDAAVKAGCKYMVVVSKHHDGFAIWDSEFSHFDLERLSFKRDILKELGEECKKQGLLYGIYFSIADIDYMGWPKMFADFDVSDEPKTGREDFMRYTKGQVKELIDRYDPDILWWDGFWQPPVWTKTEGEELYRYVKSLKSNIIGPRLALSENSRTTEGFISNGADGDYFTVEGHNLVDPPYPWECASAITYPHYAYEPDVAPISKEKLIRFFDNTLCGNGNLLMNIGPKPDGELPVDHLDRFYDLANWINENKPAVYKTEGGPFKQGDWGGSTFKGKNLYIHIREKVETLEFNSLFGNKVLSMKDLKTGKDMKFTCLGDMVTIQLPDYQDRILPVIHLEMEKEIEFTRWLPLIKNRALAGLPQLGTEIWIEPGMSKEEIFNLAKITAEAGFKDVRLFLMWTHMEPKLDKWTFDVYDWTFEACEKYKLKIQATLNANHPTWFYGEEYYGSIHTHGLLKSEDMKGPAAKYIQRVVERYKDSPSLDYWWIMNEPYPMDGEDESKLTGFRVAMRQKYKTIHGLNKMWNTGYKSFADVKNISRVINSEWAAAVPYYDWKEYCNQYLTDFQRWVRDEVLKYDTKHPFTTNPGAYLSLYHRQDASEWQNYIDAFGLSIHPTWHFDMFSQNQYVMAVAATCELGRTIADYNPIWVSELSIGNSMYALCPSANEVAQWTWVGLAKGAQKTIYWSLNPRPIGNESGEWAMLDYQNQPTPRMEAAMYIAKVIEKESDFLSTAKPLESDIIIMLSQESVLSFSRKGYGNIHNEAAMACYQALSERGIAVSFEQAHDFDWANAKGKAIIMPEVYTIPNKLVYPIKSFLKNGNKMIVLGAFGYFNQFEDCMYMNFPFKEEFGAEPQDVQSLTNHFNIAAPNGDEQFPVYKILGSIKPNKAKTIMQVDELVTGIRNRFGKSEIVWIHAGVGAGAWKYGNTVLSQFLADELKDYSNKQAFSFASQTDNVAIQTMTTDSKVMTVITNGLDKVNTVTIEAKTNKTARIIYCTEAGRNKIKTGQQIDLYPRECLVLMWE